MTTSVEYQTSTKKKDSDFIKLQQNFVEVLESFGIKKIEDIPVGSHKKSEKSNNSVWIIK